MNTLFRTLACVALVGGAVMADPVFYVDAEYDLDAPIVTTPTSLFYRSNGAPMTITGSGPVKTNVNGVGVVGGEFDKQIDDRFGPEFIEFNFEKEAIIESLKLNWYDGNDEFDLFVDGNLIFSGHAPGPVIDVTAFASEADRTGLVFRLATPGFDPLGANNNFGPTRANFQAQPNPEPGTMLMVAGIAGLAVWRRRRRKAAA